MDRIPLYDLEPFGRVSVTRRHAIDIAVVPVHQAPVGAAEANRALEQVFKDQLQVEGRPADDLEHVGRRSLLLQRFGELRPSLGEFAPAYFKLLLHIARRLARLTNDRFHFRLRSGRTKLAAARSALRVLARQGHPRSTRSTQALLAADL